jgi:hypothetical protein
MKPLSWVKFAAIVHVTGTQIIQMLVQLFDSGGPEHTPQKCLFTCLFRAKQFPGSTTRSQVARHSFLSDRNCNNDHFRANKGEGSLTSNILSDSPNPPTARTR